MSALTKYLFLGLELYREDFFTFLDGSLAFFVDEQALETDEKVLLPNELLFFTSLELGLDYMVRG